MNTTVVRSGHHPGDGDGAGCELLDDLREQVPLETREDPREPFADERFPG